MLNAYTEVSTVIGTVRDVFPLIGKHTSQPHKQDKWISSKTREQLIDRDFRLKVPV